ncbi:hypothetical protein [Moorena sp. SIO3H5]|uniref:hypothetical protein n=1 Tax=Moorena sp. SIO3H5 TaxID=2607834 RepID=UPI0013BDAF2D|nr:hypothetical protein [Moorena sp. SIO3H5]NEO73221.1 hypothetical protein [Moorena sp. SIO3H5]
MTLSLTIRQIGSACKTAALIGIMALSAIPARAHETRVVGAYKVTVGFRNEPAFEDVVNAVDVILRNAADDSPVDTDKEDKIDLDVYVLYLKEDKFDAQVIRKAKLKGELRKAFGTDNRYNIWFKPTHDGAYGYRVKGTINGQQINEKFVCGGGTKDFRDGRPRSFRCVVDPQTFPGNRNSNNNIDNAGYRDNDRFNRNY